MLVKLKPGANLHFGFVIFLRKRHSKNVGEIDTCKGIYADFFNRVFPELWQPSRI